MSVDLWDLTKMLFRRWYVALPLLLAGGAVTLTVFAAVRPDYTETTYFQFIPPSETTGHPATTNPWLSLGLTSLRDATVVSVQGQATVEDLESRGLAVNFVLSAGESPYLVSCEVVAASPAAAKATSDRVFQLFDETVRSLQAADGATDPATLITSRRLGIGDNITVSHSKSIRALVAAGAASMILAIAVTVALDAVLRRRARRRAGRADPFDGSDTVVRPSPVHPGRREPGWDRSDAAHPASPAPNLPLPTVSTLASASRLQNLRVQTQGAPEPVVEYRSAGTGRNGDPVTVIPPEATIVLPLGLSSGDRRQGRDDRSDKP